MRGAWDSWCAHDFPNWACAPLALRECSRATIARQREGGVTSLLHNALSRSRKPRKIFYPQARGVAETRCEYRTRNSRTERGLASLVACAINFKLSLDQGMARKSALHQLSRT